MGLRDRFSRKKNPAPDPGPVGGEQEAGPGPDEMPTIVQGAPVPGPGVPEDQTFVAPPQEPAPVEPAPAGQAPQPHQPDLGAPQPHQPDAGPQEGPPPGDVPAAVPRQAAPSRPGFRERGRLRRRLRYLREVRELGYRDLGGLVLDQHRFMRPNEELVAGKVEAIEALDREMRAIEQALAESTPYTELFIPGLSACPRCGALHGSDAQFCPQCGLAFKGPRTVAGVGTAEAAAGAPAYPPAPVPPAFDPSATMGTGALPGTPYPPAPRPPAHEPPQETEIRPPGQQPPPQ